MHPSQVNLFLEKGAECFYVLLIHLRGFFFFAFSPSFRFNFSIPIHKSWCFHHLDMTTFCMNATYLRSRCRFHPTSPPGSAAHRPAPRFQTGGGTAVAEGFGRRGHRPVVSIITETFSLQKLGKCRKVSPHEDCFLSGNAELFPKFHIFSSPGLRLYRFGLYFPFPLLFSLWSGGLPRRPIPHKSLNP